MCCDDEKDVNLKYVNCTIQATVVILITADYNFIY